MCLTVGCCMFVCVMRFTSFLILIDRSLASGLWAPAYRCPAVSLPLFQPSVSRFCSPGFGSAAPPSVIFSRQPRTMTTNGPYQISVNKMSIVLLYLSHSFSQILFPKPRGIFHSLEARFMEWFLPKCSFTLFYCVLWLLGLLTVMQLT